MNERGRKKESSMLLHVCKRKNKTNNFMVGTNNFKVEAVKDHEKKNWLVEVLIGW